MPRFARLVVVDVPHHITQRGNARQIIFAHNPDRSTYLQLLQHYSQLHRLSLLGYCLMSNHVHLIAIPHTAEALAQSLKHAHGRYASYWNALRSSSGHVWQGRFYSCPLGESHLWPALRYVELNPVRAGLVSRAQQWTWSSAALHCGDATAADTVLEMDLWRTRWTEVEWRHYLAQAESESNLRELRQFTHTGRPLGTSDFVSSLEQSTARWLLPRNGGRPRKPAAAANQAVITFVA
jgi:putative transposase